MKNLSATMVIAVALLSFIPHHHDVETFKQLYGLEGMWLMKTSKGFIGEEWKKVDQDYLQNRGFMIRGMDTIITETVALRNKADGIFYISTVEQQNNKQPVAFKLTSGSKGSFVFENPEHDFPKRITYQLVNKDSVYAWIDGGAANPRKRSSFEYNRIR